MTRLRCQGCGAVVSRWADAVWQGCRRHWREQRDAHETVRVLCGPVVEEPEEEET